MTKFYFWQRWLFIAGLIISAFGFLMALLNGTIIFALFDKQINPTFWSNGIIPENMESFQTFAYGVLGATIAGWGVFIAFIAYYPFRDREKWAWYCLLIGLLLWYLLDTSISIYFKVYFNAFIVNTSFLLITITPLVFTRRYFDK